MTSFTSFMLSSLLSWMTISAESDNPVVNLPFSVIGEKAPSSQYALPPLPYGFADLEPYIDEGTVRAHYLGHHDTYRKKMNDILEDWHFHDPINHLTSHPIADVLRHIEQVPENIREKLKNNAGGFVNHAIYWGIFSPNSAGKERLPTGALFQEIEKSYSSYSSFKAQFSQEVFNFFGSGYVWLVRNPDGETDKQLSIITTKNQDSPISQGLDPLLVFDVWEHAYYLKHQFRRAGHLNDWWMLIDWNNVESLDKFWIKSREPRPEQENGNVLFDDQESPYDEL